MQLIAIPDHEPKSLERAQERAFQVIQLRLMKEVLASLNKNGKAGDSDEEKELTKLITQLTKTSREHVSALKGLKGQTVKVDTDGLETAMKRAMPKHAPSMSMEMPSMKGLKGSMDKLASAMSDLMTQMGKKQSAGREHPDQFAKAVAKALPRSRSRTFGSNY